jgi:hypothetical protein
MKKIFLLLIFFGHFLSSFGQFSGGGGSVSSGSVISEVTSYFLDPQVQTNAPTISSVVDGQSVERIWWNVADKSDPNIVYNNANGTFLLKAGGKYRVTYQVNARHTPSATYQAGVFNYTTAQYEQVSFHNGSATQQSDQIVAGHREVFGTAIIDATGGNRNIGIAFSGGFGSWSSYFDATAFTPALSNAQMAKWNNITIEKISGNLPVTGQTAGNGSVILNNQVFSTNVNVASTNGIYAIPSAGVWKLRYDIQTDGSGVTVINPMVAILTSGGAIVAGSEKARAGASTVGQGLTAEVIVTTTGASNYFLNGRIGAASGSFTILNTANAGQSTITWEQIGSSATTQFVGSNGVIAGQGGFVPAPSIADNTKFLKGDGTWSTPAGSTSTCIYASISAQITIGAVSAQDILFNQVGVSNGITLNGSGEFLLQGGVTYELDASCPWQVNSGTAVNGNVVYSWVDSSNNLIGTTGNVGVSSFGSNGGSTPGNGVSQNAKLIYTPTFTQTVKVRITNGNIGGAANIALYQRGVGYPTPYVTIKSI